jgi:hypothetical protein
LHIAIESSAAIAIRDDRLLFRAVGRRIGAHSDNRAQFSNSVGCQPQ